MTVNKNNDQIPISDGKHLPSDRSQEQLVAFNSKPLLKTIGLTKYFGGLAALSGIDLTISNGEIVGLIGPNGAGKTTYFSVVSGSLRPDQGKVLFDGVDITGLPSHKVCGLGMARTFQVPKPFNHLTVLENMLVGATFGRDGSTRKQALEKGLEVLSFIGLEEKVLQLAGTLTLVERKKLEVARVLSTNPKLVLLDEVIGGLNPSEVDEMIHLIRKLRQSGLTILLIEHVMRAVMSLSDRVIVIDYGKKLSEGSSEEVSRDPRVIEAYLGVKTDA